VARSGRRRHGNDSGLFRNAGPGALAGAGSVLLLPEVLGKPLRDGSADEVRALAGLLARLDLRPVDRATAPNSRPACPAVTGSGRPTPPTSRPPWASAPTGSSPTTSATSPPLSRRSASPTPPISPILLLEHLMCLCLVYAGQHQCAEHRWRAAMQGPPPIALRILISSGGAPSWPMPQPVVCEVGERSQPGALPARAGERQAASHRR
jgi:hypothetical protein